MLSLVRQSGMGISGCFGEISLIFSTNTLNFMLHSSLYLLLFSNI